MPQPWVLVETPNLVLSDVAREVGCQNGLFVLQHVEAPHVALLGQSLPALVGALNEVAHDIPKYQSSSLYRAARERRAYRGIRCTRVPLDSLSSANVLVRDCSSLIFLVRDGLRYRVLPPDIQSIYETPPPRTDSPRPAAESPAPPAAAPPP